jgi:AbrB family looped-hinge helix DNA binding protein
MHMPIAKSKVTAQGQISVPAEIRKKLGIGPGSTLEWYDEHGNVVIRRAGSFSSAEIHQALFPKGLKAKVPPDVKTGIRKYIRQRHAGR